MWFSKETFQTMIAAGWVVDGRGGGLVIGRSHDTGDIHIIQEMEDRRFHIPACMEGGEYILNFDAYQANEERVNQINEFKESHPLITSIELTDKTRLLNTQSEPYDKLLWIDSRGQFMGLKGDRFILGIAN